ncbi:Rrf2 family transcriptional regulator [Sphingobacterium sp. DN00404]|uniref:Rrf2 family transcriptional regulator n=1 Tax=Sphingobacterium micropteri TaxID=2763501 RepID=A0ABR7YU13_9SPHI|nr:Rrf2 family transcriptional regulator [Sphingobacterium micropteri]MBD1434825.1 Rrf2 family transcriptional regulator [Sphingobacterium micropteri]
MGFFSKTCEYALRAVMYIAAQSSNGKKVGIKEVADKINSPAHFLGKILQNLSKDGIIQSTKGPQGGFYISQEGLKKPLADIVIAIEGAQFLNGCGMGLSYCSQENPCPLHDDFKEIRDRLNLMLHKTTIGQFNEKLIQGVLTLNK